jgi:EpsI family protein
MPAVHRLWILAPALLVVQALAVHWVTGAERPPAAPDLTQFPRSFGQWAQLREDPTSATERAELGADRILSRTFAGGSPQVEGSVFVAWFRSQRAGLRQPHSPKVCLPGAGWIPESTGEIRIETAAGAITVNRYVVSQKSNRAVVLYWYQAPRRVTAGEWESKFWVVADALRDRRTDTSLVRIVTWPAPGKDEAATAAAIQLARDVYPLLRKQLPGL